MMIRRACSVIGAVGAVLSFAGLPGCGQVKDVLDTAGNGGARGQDGGAESNTGGSFAGGAPSGAGSGNVAGQNAQGSGGQGGTASGGMGGWPGQEGGLTTADPHAAERRALAEESCNLLTKNPCLTWAGLRGDDPRPTSEETIARCVQAVETGYVDYGDRCWDGWVASMECGIARTDYCPCSEDGCFFSPQFASFGGRCDAAFAALTTCITAGVTIGTETGRAGDYSWNVNANGCQAYGAIMDGPTVVDSLSADCKGPPGGAQECFCNVNGNFLGDQTDAVANGGTYVSWQASDCRDVARQLADGRCADILDCCFTWISTSQSGATIEQCGCGSNPSRIGYESCEAFAASGSATVVDYCPRYRPDEGASR
jgi:hypothetical protein